MPILMFILKKLIIFLASAIAGCLYAIFAFRVFIWLDELWTKTMVAFRKNRTRIVFKRP